MRRAVSARSSAVIGGRRRRCTSCLQARAAIGPLATSAATIASTFGIERVGAAHLVHEAHRLRLRALKRSAVTK